MGSKGARLTPTASTDVSFRGQHGLPTVTHSVLVFHTAASATRAYRAMAGAPLASCVAAVMTAPQKGISIRLTSRERLPITIAGKQLWVYRLSGTVATPQLHGIARFDSLTLVQGRAIALRFFGSDPFGQEAANEGALIALAAARLGR